MCFGNSQVPLSSSWSRCALPLLLLMLLSVRSEIKVGDTVFASLSAALTAIKTRSAESNIIQVGSGSYLGELNRNLLIDKNVTIQTNGAVTIALNYSVEPLFTVSSPYVSLSIDGGIDFIDSASPPYFDSPNGYLNLSGCRFLNFSKEALVVGRGHLEIRNVTFSAPAYASSSTTTMVALRIRNVSDTEENDGSNYTRLVVNSTFEHLVNGGGISMESPSSEGFLEIRETVFRNISDPSSLLYVTTAAVFAAHRNVGPVRVHNCTFLENSVIAIYGQSTYSPIAISNSSFVGNMAGAIRLELLLDEYEQEKERNAPRVQIEDSTFAYNSLTSESLFPRLETRYDDDNNLLGGGAIAISRPTDITRCDFRNNTAENRTGGDVLLLAHHQFGVSVIQLSNFTTGSSARFGGCVATFQELHLSNVKMEECNAERLGGALLVKGYVRDFSLRVSNSSLRLNNAREGGAMYENIASTSFVEITNSSFEHNTANTSDELPRSNSYGMGYGGALSLTGFGSFYCNSSSFSYSYSTEQGGAIFTRNRKASFAHTNFTNNTARARGAAVYSICIQVDPAACVFSVSHAFVGGNVVLKQTANVAGAAFAVFGGYINVVMKQNEIWNNTVQSGGGQGGTLVMWGPDYTAQGTLELEGNRMFDNTATEFVLISNVTQKLKANYFHKNGSDCDPEKIVWNEGTCPETSRRTQAKYFGECSTCSIWRHSCALSPTCLETSSTTEIPTTTAAPTVADSQESTVTESETIKTTSTSTATTTSEPPAIPSTVSTSTSTVKSTEQQSAVNTLTTTTEPADDSASNETTFITEYENSATPPTVDGAIGDNLTASTNNVTSRSTTDLSNEEKLQQFIDYFKTHQKYRSFLTEFERSGIKPTLSQSSEATIFAHSNLPSADFLSILTAEKLQQEIRKYIVLKEWTREKIKDALANAQASTALGTEISDNNIGKQYPNITITALDGSELVFTQRGEEGKIWVNDVLMGAEEFPVPGYVMHTVESPLHQSYASPAGISAIMAVIITYMHYSSFLNA